ncbi:MAG: HAMP domain-containing histidine kinase [Anaerolineae bacterium]|nr:HAMP domain-containing histidine kinase [Anaerolineae bacterium]
MAEPTTAEEAETAQNDGDALAQAHALLNALREQAAANAPGLVDGLAQLGALLDASADQAAQAVREENTAFISIMAHELRIPLTSIRGYIDMMAKGHTGPLNDMQKQFADVIQNNTLRMQQLVDDVNTVSKIRGGRLKPEIGMDMYKNLVMGVEKETRALAEARGHTVTYQTPDGLPFLKLDAAKMKDALVRLVQNALLYTPPGAGPITVTGTPEAGGVRVVIQDHGIGMSEKDLAKLDVPFERGDDDLVRQHKGHGLGFVIARSYIEMMGGSITVESAPGAGTMVSVMIPGIG